MAHCPACNNDTPDGSRFCPSCGGALDPSVSDATRTSIEDDRASEASPAPPPSTSQPSLDKARFLPGTELAGRYRIVGLLGRGGMGEVYRAEDLKLGRPVALKFLPSGLERDPGRLERLLNEVSVALRVTHANVCRVYDIAESEGQHFLSMEYVDGEDLGSLLRRIGHLPKDKALQIARQMCAGLAAAHDEGILHRDLKPANVMLDGRGRAKIADFGLARLEHTIEGDEVRSGTPAYMAPEQLAGKEVTVRSDIYSLGLVLYELFTGKPAVTGKTAAEITKQHQRTTPTSPSSHVEGFDPAVERVILRCLERDPANRPGSAMAVAAALPGGDPLAAALAAGETPSPQMVADAGTEGGLRPPVALACVAVLLAGTIGVGFAVGSSFLVAQAPFDRAPQLLRAKAEEIIKTAGYTEPPTDWTSDYESDGDWLTHARQQPAESRWTDVSTVRPSPVHYWYRQSPRNLVTPSMTFVVTPDNPPETVSGMAGVRLDSRAQLLRLLVVPPQRDESETPPSDVDWSPLIEASGLEPSSLTSVRPIWNPPVAHDVRVAWETTYPDQPDVTVRVEAAAYRGRPVWFEVILPWTRASGMAAAPSTAGQTAANVALLSIFGMIVIGGGLLARRNLRLGRGDRQGAFRVAVLVLSQTVLAWSALAHHVLAFAEVGWVVWVLSRGLFFGACFWMSYVALEPYVRRLWPETLITWSRLIQGRFNDPRVGRDVLLGGVAASVILLFSRVWFDALKPSLGMGASEPNSWVWFLEGGQAIFYGIGASLLGALQGAMGLLLLIVLFRILLRNRWAAIIAMWLLWSTVQTLGSADPSIDWIFHLLTNAVFLFVLIRLGLLAGIATLWFVLLALSIPFTVDFSSWYAVYSLIAVAVLVAVALYSFYISLAGRPLVRDEVLDSEAPAA
jgi:hypothetical protein